MRKFLKGIETVFLRVTTIQNSSGQEALKTLTGSDGSSVPGVYGGTTGQPAVLYAQGNDTNVSMGIRGKGTGTPQVLGSADASKILAFDVNGATASTTTTLIASQTTNRTLTIPNATDTLMGKATSDIMTNKTYSLSGAGNVLNNPYKFSVYRNAAANSGNNAYAKVVWDTEEFDSNSNFATGTYTAPVAGFYQFNATVSYSTGSADDNIALYKNGSIFKWAGETIFVTAGTAGYSSGSWLVQSAQGDTWEIYAFANTTTALKVGANQNHFSGYLISHT